MWGCIWSQVKSRSSNPPYLQGRFWDYWNFFFRITPSCLCAFGVVLFAIVHPVHIVVVAIIVIVPAVVVYCCSGWDLCAGDVDVIELKRVIESKE